MASALSIILLGLALHWTNTEASVMSTLKKLIADCPPIEVVFVAEEPCVNYEATIFDASSGSQGSDDLLAVATALTGGLVGYTCETTVCGNGEPVSGSYCGVGSCNAFGRNCDGGCIAGNSNEAVAALKAKYPGIKRATA